MNIAELYSLTSGQKIDKINILEKFYPLPFDKYITFHPFSKPSKNYDYYQNVIDIILPYLQKENIKIVQIGGQNENGFNGCYFTQGNTNYGQVAFLIKNSILNFGADSFSSHLAGHFNKSLVTLISNNFKETVQPYFGDKSKQIILEPDRTNKNPSFMLDEGPKKQINEIKPELIAYSILKLLNIEYKPTFKTLCIGHSYNNRMIHLIPNQNINPAQLGLQSLIVRMDIEFNEQFLAQQLNICPCSIITNKPININLLQTFKSRVLEVIYLLNKDHKVEFVKQLADLKINYRLISELDNEELNKIKLDYIDFNLIIQKDDSIPPEITNTEIEKLMYTTTQFYLSRGKIYSSEYGYKIGQSLKEFKHEMLPVMGNDTYGQYLDFLRKEKDFIYFSEKLD